MFDNLKKRFHKFDAYETVHVYLTEEGCYRPTQARHIAGDTFELLPTDDYDPEIETWEFAPGSIVKCAVTSGQDGVVILAKEQAQD